MSSILAASADIAARASSGGGDKSVWFNLQPGETATVRFLEQGDDIAWAWMHELPPRGNQRWGDEIPCLDQVTEPGPTKGQRKGEACPGCQEGADRSFSGFINLIWRNGPIYARNEDGSFKLEGEGKNRKKVLEGRGDVLAVWNKGIRVFEELAGKDATYKGLMSRDFVITRHGADTNTRWNIEPLVVDGETKAVPMSEADKKLAEGKRDFTADTTPPSYDDYVRKAKGEQGNSGVKPEDVQQKSPFAQAGDTSAFMKPGS